VLLSFPSGAVHRGSRFEVERGGERGGTALGHALNSPNRPRKRVWCKLPSTRISPLSRVGEGPA